MPKKLAVLLVEDSADDALLIERQLHGGGFDIAATRVETAADMRDELDRQDWDLVICDHSLPGFSAPEALAALKDTGLDIPFIIVSGTIDMGVAVSAMRAGAQDFIEKDNLARLNPAIERELRDARERRKRREAEMSLRDRERRMRLIFEQTPVVLWSADEDLKYTSFAGHISTGKLGFAEEDVLGLPVAGTTHAGRVGGNDGQDIRKFVKMALRGQPTDYDFRFGDMIWHSHVEPFRDENDNVIGVIGVSYDITEEVKQGDLLRESERQLRYLSHRLLVAHEDERKRIARDIHDSIGQSLAAIKIRTQNVMNRIETNAPRTPETSLEAVLPVIQQTIDEVRRMQADLHPAVLDDFGIVAAIKNFIKSFRSTYPTFKVTTKLAVREEAVPAPLRPAIFRVVQESMNNVAKHSGGDTVCVCLTVRDHALTLQVTDNGRGFDVSRTAPASILKGALGLVSMRERVQLSGGVFNLTSKPGIGTKIKATWPVGS